MPRALIQCVGQDRTGRVRARAWPPAGSSSCQPVALPRRSQQRALPVVGFRTVTGFPEMMDGRVKTLHPKMHGGILARRSRGPTICAAAASHGIALIDLVVVNLYPFVKAAPNPDTPFEALIEEIDIGGPSLVRAAAKNFPDVLVVVSPADYARVLEAARSARRPVAGVPFRSRPQGVRAHRRATTRRSPRRWLTVTADDVGFTRDRPADAFRRRADDRPAQGPRPALRREPASARRRSMPRVGPHPGYCDASGQGAVVHEPARSRCRGRAIVLEFSEPAAAVIKHTNPCGAATGTSAADAYVRAREADALSAFGGVVAPEPSHRRGDRARDRLHRIDAVIAPAVEDDARAILATKAKMRVVVPERRAGRRRGGAVRDLELRSIVGAVLVQTRDRVIEAHAAWPSADLQGRDADGSRRPRNGRRSDSPGGSARTSSRTPSSSRPPIARWRSAPVR